MSRVEGHIVPEMYFRNVTEDSSVPLGLWRTALMFVVPSSTGTGFITMG